VGVLHRVEVLADREEGFVPPSAKHFESLIPLHEVIASSTGFSVSSKKVKEKYEDLLRNRKIIVIEHRYVAHFVVFPSLIVKVRYNRHISMIRSE